MDTLKKKKRRRTKGLIAETRYPTSKNLNNGIKREGTFSKPKPGKAGRKDKPYKFNPKAVLLDVGHMEGGAIAEERLELFNDVQIYADWIINNLIALQSSFEETIWRVVCNGYKNSRK